MSAATCRFCRKKIPKTTPRVTIDNAWVCEDCAYLIEHPNAKRARHPPAPHGARTSHLRGQEGHRNVGTAG